MKDDTAALVEYATLRGKDSPLSPARRREQESTDDAVRRRFEAWKLEEAAKARPLV